MRVQVQPSATTLAARCREQEGPPAGEFVHVATTVSEATGTTDASAGSSVPAIVLDTNVVLDWLLFDRPSLRPIGAAIVERRLRWLVSAPLRVEFALVVERGIRGWTSDPAALLDAWDRWGSVREVAPLGGQPGRLRCTDASDQKFIDFAVATGASALLSRDRAVLKVARRAGERGVAIVTPERWAAAVGAGS